MTRTGVFFVVLALLTSCLPAQAASEGGMVNGGFEGGTARATAYWTPSGGPYHTEYEEISTPEGWVTWWREDFDCTGTPDFQTGRPEVKVIDGPDGERVHGGEQAVQWFTFWRCHDGGLYQQVAVTPGEYYSIRAYGHAWYSRCSYRPHGPPLEADCQTPITWAHDRLSVGIDPTGGTDPLAGTVAWGEAREVYGVYGLPLSVERVQARARVMTVFLRSEASHPLKHDDVYWDDVSVMQVACTLYLPLMLGGE